MKLLDWCCKWFIIGAFAGVAGMWFGMPPQPIETGYSRQQADLQAALVAQSIADADARKPRWDKRQRVIADIWNIAENDTLKPEGIFEERKVP